VLRNDQIQAAWVSYLKSNITILAELDDNEEIREDGWKGSNFTYPNIRVRLIDNTPVNGSSSQQADRIAGIIMTELHDTQFVSNNISFGVRTTSLAPAIWSDEQTWRSEAIMSIRASG
jgi:hypothetical protein